MFAGMSAVAVGSIHLLCMVVCSILLLQGQITESASNVGIRHQFHMGQNATLPCHTNLDHDVDWTYQTSQDASQQYVYTNGLVYVSFRPKFRVESPSTGDFKLIIDDVQRQEAGLYTCTEDGGLGTRHTMELVVIDAELSTAANQIHNGTTTASSTTSLIVGVAVGGAVLITVIVVLIVWLLRRNRGQRHETKTLSHEESETRGSLLHGMKTKDASVRSNTLSTASLPGDNGCKESGAGDGVSTMHDTQRGRHDATDLNDSKVETPCTEDDERSEADTCELKQLKDECRKDAEPSSPSAGQTLNQCGQANNEYITGNDQQVIDNDIRNDAVETGEHQDKRTDTEDSSNECSSPSGIKPLQGGHVLDMAGKFDTPITPHKSVPVNEARWDYR